MPYAEFVGHIAYHELLPWGDDWKQTNALAATISDASPKFKRIDLTPFFPKPRQQDTSIVGMFETFKDLAVNRG